ncbi:MAG TPA: RNase adapter RapZ [Rhodospirillaceae bacterium]|nr:RNase adapter RapZ [Rhodospirillaceae bacterium]
MNMTTAHSLVIVTGLSGAGISSTMAILEDMGFSAFDNFPLPLLPALLEQEKQTARPVAVSLDTRTRNFDPTALMAAINRLKEGGDWKVKTLFLSADDAVLLKRFSETRRVHPLARDRAVADGIAAEKSLLYPLKHEAGQVVDTSDYSVHDLRRFIEGFAGGMLHGHLNISLMSFSYRHGLPREADLVFDVRFLRNPNWDKDLKSKTGLSADVQNYVRADDAYVQFLGHLQSMFDILLPRYKAEGKSYLTIAFGCTGGKHRSVTVTEDMATYVAKTQKILPVIHHRELKS